MKLNDILLEVDMSAINRSDASVIGSLNTDVLEDLYASLERGALGGLRVKDDEPFKKYLHQLGFIPTDFYNAEYVDNIMMAIEDELSERGPDDEENWDDYRDYDEEDRMAAWEERYHMYKNEY